MPDPNPTNPTSPTDVAVAYITYGVLALKAEHDASLKAGAGTPINWLALIQKLLPVILQLLSMFFPPPTPGPTPPAVPVTPGVPVV